MNKNADNNYTFLIDHAHSMRIWSPKNTINPSLTKINSSKDAIWRCSQNHEWVAPIRNVSLRESKCKYCTNKALLTGFNDLKTTHPQVAQFWSKDNHLKSDEVIINSTKKANWECDKGHIWSNTIRQQIRKKHQCSFCHTEKVNEPDDSMLESIYSARNKKPYSSNLPKTVNLIWNCLDCNNEYKQTLVSMKKGTGCPYCARRIFKKGTNDLVTLKPEILNFWSPKNTLNPEEYNPTSTEEVKWHCNTCLGEWEGLIVTHYNKDIEKFCPYCSDNKTLSGKNDLLTVHPKIASTYNEEKNEIPANKISHRSHTEVYWKAKCGHEWQQPVIHRTKSKIECLVCASVIFVPGVNSLLKVKPYVQKYFNFENNINPNQIEASKKETIVNLKCEKNHSWEISTQKIKETIVCPYCSNKKTLKGFNDLATTHPYLLKDWDKEKNYPIIPENITAGSHTRIYWVCEKNHNWDTNLNDRTFYKTNCPTCAIGKKSSYEEDLANWIESLGVIIKRNKRKDVGVEIDILIEEHKIAIEFNGVYWDSEKAGKTKNYHYDKWLKCKNNGYQLIQIWEDDWKTNEDLIKTMIKHKLNLSTQSKTYARKTLIQQVDKETATKFLNENHIQGNANGSIRIGLTFNNELVALMVLKKERNNTMNLVRYATNNNVIGGFTKLLKYVEKTYTPSTIITFSDNTVSDGKLYSNNNFVKTAEIPPDYSYLIGAVRKHKFNYRKKKFKNDPNLVYVENLTEKELAKINNLNRVWDAGKIKWTKTL